MFVIETKTDFDDAILRKRKQFVRLAAVPAKKVQRFGQYRLHW
jgi:hypothetical protein